jgi:cytosine/adenosine deaminase-related metal-dependent hydrolase
VAVARRFGIRLVLARGGATIGADDPGHGECRPTPVQPLASMLDHIDALARRYHDPAPDAMLRVAAAPSTPFWSVTPGDLETIAAFARERGLRLHTHLSETADSAAVCVDRYGMRPVPWLAQRGWLGEDVWFAHAVHLDDDELRMLAATGTGIAHCPQSNARLGAGIAPADRFAALGGRVSLGVDGAASNESGSMLDDVHAAWLIHRARNGPQATRAEEVVRWATAGGAAVLGLDVGELAIGKPADLAIWPLDHPRYAGVHDEAIAPVVCGGGDARHVFVAGRPVVFDGAIPGLDLSALAASARDLVRSLDAAVPS